MRTFVNDPEKLCKMIRVLRKLIVIVLKDVRLAALQKNDKRVVHMLERPEFSACDKLSHKSQ